ncbi:PREDICTED: polyhomeotic-like protein 2 [Nanorana parkeri]|uniref:polyhomeotic-like protein 2 n=1 Tax=Nanorana parkeri TaxID=125878 RepID=UPI000854E7C6|nr:PREDICTED: polyhomeotic-like protein 2 [Nanorana parkeri]
MAEVCGWMNVGGVASWFPWLLQVIQQALSRQPNTAAQYLQQMYAAQQQHLMLQSAALQQQHLTSAQLQSLASAQQVTLCCIWQGPCWGMGVHPSCIHVLLDVSSPQIIQRPQTVGSTPAQASGITQQAVLLGNASSPALSTSQAQMYLRAQMLIFTPTVSSIQSDVSSASSSQPPPISTQVQNLTVRGAIGETGALNQTQLPTLAMKPATLSLHPVIKPAGCVGSHTADTTKKGESPATDSQAPTNRTTVATHAVMTPAYPPQLVPEPKPVLHQLVIQNRPHSQPRPLLPLTHQPQVSQGLSSPPITSQAPLVPASSCVESDKQKSNPVLPLLPQRPTFGGQDGAVQCRLLPASSAVIFQIPRAVLLVFSLSGLRVFRNTAMPGAPGLESARQQTFHQNGVSYPPQLVPEPKPVLHQLVIQNRPHSQPRPLLPLTHQPQVSQGLSSPPITSQAPLVPASSCVESDKQKSNPVLPLLPQRPTFGGQDGAVQCRLLPASSAVIFQIPRAVTPPQQDNPQKSCHPHRGHRQPPTRIPAAAHTNHLQDKPHGYSLIPSYQRIRPTTYSRGQESQTTSLQQRPGVTDNLTPAEARSHRQPHSSRGQESETTSLQQRPGVRDNLTPAEARSQRQPHSSRGQESETTSLQQRPGVRDNLTPAEARSQRQPHSSRGQESETTSLQQRPGVRDNLTPAEARSLRQPHSSRGQESEITSLQQRPGVRDSPVAEGWYTDHCKALTSTFWHGLLIVEKLQLLILCFHKSTKQVGEMMKYYSSQTQQSSSPPLDMTSGNGSSPLPAAAPGSTPQNAENKPPQAVVRPQILTHVIEGFVIQEGAQPFPSHRSRAALEVGRSSLLVAAQEKCQLLAEKLPQQDNNTTTDSEMEEPSVPESKSDGDPPKLKCELCGRVDLEYKFKRSKRFCSMACAKRVSGSVTPSSVTPLSVSSTLKHTNSQEESSRCSENSSYEEPLSPISASSSLPCQHHQDMEMTDLHPGDTLHINHNFLPSDPTKWNVEDVYEFIRSLPGCQEISEEFRVQEIDGQALLLLKEDHLMSAMNIKLGPALKIYARITMLKDS